MSDLDKLILELYHNQISEAEANIAGRQLAGFFALLHKIDQRQKQEKLISNNQSNDNLEIYENNRSSN